MLRKILRRIKKLVNKTKTPPFDKKLVTIKTQDYPRSNFIVQLTQLLRRYLMLFVFFQYKYLKDRISINEKNILWIHNTTENIGDSLMKTSSIRYLDVPGNTRPETRPISIRIRPSMRRRRYNQTRLLASLQTPERAIFFLFAMGM